MVCGIGSKMFHLMLEQCSAATLGYFSEDVILVREPKLQRSDALSVLHVRNSSILVPI